MAFIANNYSINVLRIILRLILTINWEAAEIKTSFVPSSQASSIKVLKQFANCFNSNQIAWIVGMAKLVPFWRVKYQQNKVSKTDLQEEGPQQKLGSKVVVSRKKSTKRKQRRQILNRINKKLHSLLTGWSQRKITYRCWVFSY